MLVFVSTLVFTGGSVFVGDSVFAGGSLLFFFRPRFAGVELLTTLLAGRLGPEDGESAAVGLTLETALLSSLIFAILSLMARGVGRAASSPAACLLADDHPTFIQHALWDGRSM